MHLREAFAVEMRPRTDDGSLNSSRKKLQRSPTDFPLKAGKLLCPFAWGILFGKRTLMKRLIHFTSATLGRSTTATNSVNASSALMIVNLSLSSTTRRSNSVCIPASPAPCQIA